MSHWWVNQYQTFRQEVSGGYLWSPERKSDGSRNAFYESMNEVAPRCADRAFAGPEQGGAAAGYNARHGSRDGVAPEGQQTLPREERMATRKKASHEVRIRARKGKKVETASFALPIPYHVRPGDTLLRNYGGTLSWFMLQDWSFSEASGTTTGTATIIPLTAADLQALEKTRRRILTQGGWL